jgi:hypothetical protein
MWWQQVVVTFFFFFFFSGIFGNSLELTINNEMVIFFYVEGCNG